MPVGTVKWFSTIKRFGFIEPEGGGDDAFVHISAVERAGLKMLVEGQKVEYELVAGQDGRSSAENIVAVDDDGPPSEAPGPQSDDAGTQPEDAGPQPDDSGPEADETGPEADETGPEADEAEPGSGEADTEAEDAEPKPDDG